MLDGANSEIAVTENFPDCGVSIEATFHERIKRSNLECRVFLAWVVDESLMRQCFDMERSEEPVINNVSGHTETVAIAAESQVNKDARRVWSPL